MLGMLKKHTVELSPEVQGRLQNGKIPIPNHEINRCLIYGDEEFIDKVCTDLQGNFKFEKKAIKSNLPGNIFHEPKVQMYITTEFHSETHLVWFSNQDGISINPLYINYLNTICADLSLKEESFWITEPNNPEKSYQIHSICRW